MSATARRNPRTTPAGRLLEAPLMMMTTVLLSSCVGQISSSNQSGSGGTTQQGTGGSNGKGSGGNSTTPGGSGGSTGPNGSGGSGNPGPGSGGASVSPLDCSAPKVQASPLRRLTRREYNNFVAVLLGDTTHPGDKFVPESQESGFLNGVESTLLSPVVVDDFEQAATALAKTATSSSALKAFVGCDPSATAGQDTCATNFIKTFGAKAFRRTLEDSQVADYQALYTSRKADGFGVAIELVVRAMLQSPYFLYRLEFGMPNPSGAPVVRLTPEETASRLALLFWGSLPDATLNQAVKDGKLSSAADVRSQAMRMLADDRADAVFSDFYVQLGQLEGLPNQTKPAPFTPDIGRLLIEETKQFVSQTLRKGDGLLTTLFTSPVTYLNKDLATYYGVSGVTSSSFVATTMPAGQRAGLLTQGSIAANFAHGAESSPVLRGKFILTQIACRPPQPPPDNVNTNLPAPDLTKTARQQLIELTGQGTCNGCHSFINPMGFALDDFDGFGRYRSKNTAGLAIDASADVVIPEDMKGHYSGHDDFLRALAASDTVRSCVSSKWFIYAHGRVPEDDDACSLSQAATAFQSDGNIRELLLKMTETPAFLYLRTQGAAP